MSNYRADVGEHAPGYLREALIRSLECYWAGTVPDWSVALGDEGVLSHFDPAFQRSWNRWPINRRARWLLGQLHNCTDIMDSVCCGQLELSRGSTFASAVRKLRREMETKAPAKA